MMRKIKNFPVKPNWKIVSLALAVTTALLAALAASFLLAGDAARGELEADLYEQSSQIVELEAQLESQRRDLVVAQQGEEQCRLAAVHLREAGTLMAQSSIDWLDAFPYAELDLSASNAAVEAANALPCESFSY